jgi:3'-5' exonuclease
VKFLILDIEAVVDTSVWTPPAAEPDQFAPPYAWRPICVGMVLLEMDARPPAPSVVTRRIGAIFEGGNEQSLLDKFAETITRLERPCVVTWNGRGYDLPVLMLRSLRYGIAHPWYYQQRDARYRYSEDGHCDLKDAMSDFGACSKLGLDGMGKLIGCPGKFGDVTGASVAEAFAQWRFDEITSYCIGDAVTTAFLFLRWQLLKGTMGHDSYRAAAGDLMARCEGEARLGQWVARVNRRVLLLEGT